MVGSRVHLDGWAEREREGGRGGAEFVVGAVHEGGGAGGPVGGQREERGLASGSGCRGEKQKVGSTHIIRTRICHYV